MKRLAVAAAVIIPAAALLVSAATVPGRRSATAKPAAISAVRIGRAHPAESIPTLDGSKPIFILVLGSDTRSKQLQAAVHSRCDSIHLIGINPKKEQATILGFPRDSWVDIEGHGKDKINDSMMFGGPELAVSTIEKLTGIHIDYFALTTFEGFKTAVTELGGVKVEVPYPIDDSHSKAEFKEGTKKMTGKEALSFVRARYGVPNGDFSRSENQGLFMTSALAQFQKQFRQDPSVLLRWIGAATRNTQTDVPFDELLTLGFTATQIENVTNLVVPGKPGTEGDQSVVFIDSSAKSLYDDMHKDGLIETGSQQGQKDEEKKKERRRDS